MDPNNWQPPPPYHPTGAIAAPPSVYPNVVSLLPIQPQQFPSVPIVPFDHNTAAFVSAIPTVPVVPPVPVMPPVLPFQPASGAQIPVGPFVASAPSSIAPFVPMSSVSVAPQVTRPVHSPAFNNNVPVVPSLIPQKVNIQVTLTIPQIPVPPIPLMTAPSVQSVPLIVLPEMISHTQRPPFTIRPPLRYEASSSFADSEQDDNDSLVVDHDHDENEDDGDDESVAQNDKQKKPKRTIEKKRKRRTSRTTQRRNKNSRTRDYIPRKCKSGKN